MCVAACGAFRRWHKKLRRNWLRFAGVPPCADPQASYWLYGILTAITVTTLAYLTGVAWGVAAMTNTDGSVIWTFLFVYELAWFSLAFLIASFFHSVQWAVIFAVRAAPIATPWCFALVHI